MCLYASRPYIFVSEGGFGCVCVSIQINHIQTKGRFYFITK